MANFIDITFKWEGICDTDPLLCCIKESPGGKRPGDQLYN